MALNSTSSDNIEYTYVVSRAERQVHLPPCTRNKVHKYRICCHNNIIKKKVHILILLARNSMCSLMMISDMLSKHVGVDESVLKSDLK